MATGFAGGPYSLAVVAETGDRFTDFSPYVAAIDEQGSVFFSATTTDGGSGVFRSDGTHVTAVAEFGSDMGCAVWSHPDADDSGSVCFYAADGTGKTALLGARDGEIARAGRCGRASWADHECAWNDRLPRSRGRRR